MSKRTDREKIIHVLYSISDQGGKYSKYTGTSICSLLENTSEPVVFHLFHDGTLSVDNKGKFVKLVRTYGQTIKFYNIPKILPKVLAKARKIFIEAMDSTRYTESALYRILAPQVLAKEIKKIIYLDSDTIVLLDIGRLWNESIGASGLAAVRETELLRHYPNALKKDEPVEKAYLHMKEYGVTLDNCFNSGVLLMDLSTLRNKGDILLTGLRFLAQFPEDNRFYDQNLLNMYFAKDLTPLPYQYNILQHWDRQYGAKGALDKGIIHYMGHTLGMDADEQRDTVFYDYFMKTPWCDGEFLCSIYGVMDIIYKRVLAKQQRQVRMFAAMSSRKQIVFAYSEEMKDAFKKFLQNPDILTEESDKLDEPLPKGKSFSLGKEKAGLDLQLPYDVDTYAYVLFVVDYKTVCSALQAAGLIEYEHFCRGTFLLQGLAWIKSIMNANLFFSKL